MAIAIVQFKPNLQEIAAWKIPDSLKYFYFFAEKYPSIIDIQTRRNILFPPVLKKPPPELRVSSAWVSLTVLKAIRTGVSNFARDPRRSTN